MIDKSENTFYTFNNIEKFGINTIIIITIVCRYYTYAHIYI